MGAVQVPLISGSMQKQPLVGPANMTVRRNGWLYVYLSNESNQDVYFDDLIINHKRGPVVQETNYYAFGMEIPGITSKALGFGGSENKYNYNGKEEQQKEFSDGSGLDEYDFGARMYNSQIGRWHVLDPMADNYEDHSPYNFVMNNPINSIDPDGMKVRELKNRSVVDMVQSAWDQTEDGGQSAWTNMDELGFLNQDDFSKVEKETQGMIRSGNYEGALKNLTSNISSLSTWANWSDISHIGYNAAGGNLLETRPDINGKSVLFLNSNGLSKYDGSSIGYSIAGLAFDLYHEFHHVNVNAGRFGLKIIGTIELHGKNPQEEFLANYYASKAALPGESNMNNYYYKRSIRPINQLLDYAFNPAQYINLYMAQIKELLRNVNKEYRDEAIRLIKSKTGITIKL